jgi:hypothetical protein
MAKYPVEISDSEGIVDAINYVLSGPAGLGQNFAGFSSSETGYLTGNFRVPYVQATPTVLYYPNIALSSAECLDSRTVKFTFATPQGTPPFGNGNTVETSGFATGFYNEVWSPIGVVECTTTYFVARFANPQVSPDPDLGGGFVNYTTSNFDTSTDCNARVTVTGGTDRVFINAQLNSVLEYVSPVTSPLYYTVKVNRYRGETNNDPTNPDYVFSLDGPNATVATKSYYTGSLEPTSGQVLNVEVTGGTSHVPRGTFPRFYGVMPEVTSGSGSLCTLDIELRPNLNQSTTGLSSGGPYFTPGPAIPYRTEPWNFKPITSCIGNGTTCTVLLTNTGIAFTVGQSITITGTSAPSFDGTYLITAATPTQIQFASAVTGTATLTSATANAAFFNTVVTVAGGGINYAVGDTLLVKGSDIGGADGTNDMTLQVTGVNNNTPVALPPYDTIFTSIIDVPGPGYYWYIMEINFDTLSGEAQMTQAQFNYRGLSAQVVKE